MKSPYCTGWCDGKPNCANGCGLTACPPRFMCSGTEAFMLTDVPVRFVIRDDSPDAMLELLREVARCGVDLADPILSCVTVRISRATWERVCAYLPQEETKP